MENAQKWKHLLAWLGRIRLPSDDIHSWYTVCGKDKTVKCFCGARKNSYKEKQFPTLGQCFHHLRGIIYTMPEFNESDHAYVGPCAREGETVTLTCMICGKEINETGNAEDEENLEIALENLEGFERNKKDELS